MCVRQFPEISEKAKEEEFKKIIIILPALVYLLLLLTKPLYTKRTLTHPTLYSEIYIFILINQ